MESSSEELMVPLESSRNAGKTRRTVTLVVGLLTMCAAVSFWHNPSIMAQIKGGFFVGLASEDSPNAASAEGCEDLPFVKLTEVVSSNLGKQGPDNNASEGIIYKAKAYNTGIDVDNLEIHVHSVRMFNVSKENDDNYDKNYRPAFTHGEFVNGLHGRFGVINVKQGETVKVRAHAYNADTKKDIPLPHAAISFFDLDAGENGTRSVEHVGVTGYKAFYTSNETEVKINTSHASGGDDAYTNFTATTEGTGEDNPHLPTELTKQQKNRAVTVVFDDAEKIEFEIGASPGKTGRVFSFVFRPSLLCAKTKLADGSLEPAKGQGAPLVPVRGAARKDLPSAVLMVGFSSAVVQYFM